MQTNLRRSLYIGLAALSFIAAAGAAPMDASAKTYAKMTSNRAMTTAATSRNVTLTGKNAIYNKAGTLKGAKTIASMTTVGHLKDSTTSQKNFRAYRVATTNRGSVYYKVVSFDKVYRGWIYGGKSTNQFGGGLASYDTFKSGTLTDAQRNGTFAIANPGTANDGTQVTYKQPAWTQYKVGRQMMNSTPYASDTFKITNVGTRTREGDRWVYVTNQNTGHGAATNGWILESGLKTVETPDPATTSKLAFSVNSINNNGVNGTGGLTLYSRIPANDLGLPRLAQTDLDKLMGETGTRIGPNGFTAIDTMLLGNMTAIRGARTYTINGSQYHYVFSYGANSISGANGILNDVWGDTLNVPLNAELVAGPASGTNNANGYV